jgi:hypothetical protein
MLPLTPGTFFLLMHPWGEELEINQLLNDWTSNEGKAQSEPSGAYVIFSEQ